MRPLLEQTLKAIELERQQEHYEAAFSLATQLHQELGSDDIAERLMKEIPDSVPAIIAADLLAILQWITTDNGSLICRQAEIWLREARDGRRAEAALYLDSLPFATREEMEQVLDLVAQRFPALSARCQELISERRAMLRRVQAERAGKSDGSPGESAPLH